jgi:hypothetical protein
LANLPNGEGSKAKVDARLGQPGRRCVTRLFSQDTKVQALGTARSCSTCWPPRPACYRHWGEGVWTDDGAELARRATEIMTHPDT